MAGKEVFWKFVQNFRVTEEEYLIAKDYYLNQALEDEIEVYNNYMEMLVVILQKCLKKSERHLKVMASKHGMSDIEARDAIKKFNTSISYLDELESKGIDRQSFLEKLYGFVIENNYIKSKILAFINKFDISYDLFRELMQKYMKEFLKLSNKDINSFWKRIETTEDFYNFLDQKIGDNFDNVIFYSRNFATREENLKFEDLILQIVAEFYFEGLSLKVMSEKIKDKYHIAIEKVRYLLGEYCSLKVDNRKDRDIYRYKEVCEMFLNDISFEDISNYLSEYNISWEYLRRKYVQIFVNTFIDEEKQESVYKKIILRMQEYLKLKKNERAVLRDKLKKEPFDELLFGDAKRIITKLVYGDQGVKTFIKALGEEKFYRYITLIEVYDQPLYELYLMRRNGKNLELDSNIIDDLFNYITKGIVINGTLREFNILDYFRIIKIPIDSMMRLLNNYNIEVKKIIGSWLLKYKVKLKYGDISKDVMEDEDYVVRQYLILNDIPMYDLVYMLVLGEYRSGLLNSLGNSRK